MAHAAFIKDAEHAFLNPDVARDRIETAGIVDYDRIFIRVLIQIDDFAGANDADRIRLTVPSPKRTIPSLNVVFTFVGIARCLLAR